jgi:uncharacterized protein (DUF4415 family)
MKSDTLPKNFPDNAKEIERLVAEAPGEDRPPTAQELKTWEGAFVSHSYEEHKAKLSARRVRGKGRRPSKILTAVRFDPDVLAGLRATGRGWQTLINNTMREWLESHAA